MVCIIRRAPPRPGPPTRWATAGARTSTTITGLTNGTTYLLQVRAHNAGGISAFSATARGTPRGAPAIPTGLTGTTPDARGNYTVSWTAVNSATSYKLRESDDGGTTWDTDYTVNTGAGRTFTDKDPR